MAETVTISQLGSTPEFQEYTEVDLRLIQQSEISSEFGYPEDYVETHIYDLNNNYLYGILENPDWRISAQGSNAATNTGTILEISPEKDIKKVGIDRGAVNVVYNFYRKLLKSSNSSPFWIKEISPSRTEIKVVNQNLSEDDLLTAYSDYQTANTVQPYHFDFLLNFGNNVAVIGVNLGLTTDVDGQTVLLVKLYEPLPTAILVKSTFWFVQKVSEPITYNLSITIAPETLVDTTPRLRGPNFSIAINQKASQAIEEYNYQDLFTAPVSSSYQQIKSLLEEKGVEINVDYSTFSNFIHFSSITDRLYNFQYKVQLIESYSADITALNDDIVPDGNTAIISSTRDILQSKINSLIEKFDGYEYYLYYESGTFSWPKYTSQKPYQLYSVTSSQARSWIGSEILEPTAGTLSMLYSASLFDNQNKDLLINTIPSYLREDPQNAPYETFLNMIGQHFDNIWIYLQDVTNKNVADNSLQGGISKDLVSDALKSLGISLYTNTNISDNLYYSLLGYNADGSLLPPTGSEKIQYYITSSESTQAAEDITLEYHKRLYHNLPYLLKTKGTERGVRALISCYGIPDTILRVNEYGGVPKAGSYAGYKQNRFSLAYKSNDTSSLVFPWAPSYYQYLKTGDANVVPDAIEFRFKTNGIPSSSYDFTSLLHLGPYDTGYKFNLSLIYNDTTIAPPSSSFEKYGLLNFIINGSLGGAVTDSIYLPFFDETQWWTVVVQRTVTGINATYIGTNSYRVTVKSSFYNEEGISQIGFSDSKVTPEINGALYTNNASWMGYTPTESGSLQLYLGCHPGGFVYNESLNGYFQEFRLWATSLSDDVIERHALNSRDYSTNNPTGSQFDLIFRAPLGNELDLPYKNTAGTKVNSNDYQQFLLGNVQIAPTAVIGTVHPAATGSYFIPQYGGIVTNVGTFMNGGSPYGYGQFVGGNSQSFTPQEFVDLVTEPSVGRPQKVNNKVIIENVITGSYGADITLSPYTSLQRFDQDRTISNQDLEIAFSPADMIDEDIMNQLGNFNIDDYIGGAADRYESKYTSLELLRDSYFRKYTSKFGVKDFARLLKYIDNSLFKLLKDFTPARATLTTGLLIKPHILERNTVARTEPSFSRTDYSSSITIGTITGSVPQGTRYLSGYTMSVITPSGSAIKVQPQGLSQITGEYSGSTIYVGEQFFEQVGVSNVTPLNSNWKYITYSLDPLYNNITGSRRSTKQYDADYSYNQLRPVNYGVITQSIIRINQGNTGSIQALTTPWAQIQDSNYSSKAYTTIRYEGSKTISKLYTTYSVGDSSYGKTAAIDRTRFKYGYLKDIYTASLTLPSRSNAQIKYLIDDAETVIDLTKENNNIFDIQNLYKGGEKVNISLFDYSNQSTSTLTNRSIGVYEGGFRYLPILHNIDNSATSFTWNYPEPIQKTITIPGGTPITTPACDLSNIAEWGDVTNWSVKLIPSSHYATPQTLGIQIRYIGTGNLPTGPNCTLMIFFTYTLGGCASPYDMNPVYASLSMNPTSNASYFSTTITFDPIDVNACDPLTVGDTIRLESVSATGTVTTGTNTPPTIYTEYTTTVADPETCLYLVTTPADTSHNNRLIQFSAVLSELLYAESQVVFDDASDPKTTTSPIERVVLPFTLEPGDAIHFPDVNRYVETEEYRVVQTFFSGSSASNTVNRRFYALLDRSVNLNVLTTPATTTVNGKFCKYIVAKHVPDETNVILRYNPIDANFVEEGILYPQDIQEPVRKNAGNIIKSLKSQGLI
jgi:hypothetical protein